MFGRIIAALLMFRTLRGKVAQELTAFDQLLEALERNDYSEAARIFLSWTSTAELIQKLPEATQPYVPIILPVFMEGLDAALPEEIMGNLLSAFGIDYEPPVEVVAPDDEGPMRMADQPGAADPE